MKNTTINDCKIIDIRKFSDTRGYLSVIEENMDIPFKIRRVYYLYNVPEEARGAHAHKTLQQLMVATSGSVHVTLDDGENKKTFVIDKPWKGLLVVPGLWRTLTDFSGGAVCMVLASEHYNTEDYIRNYEEFLNYRRNLR
ncbi:MAG: FdtA/QdtA family cupin domain-containing protein [Bacteroidaceae bacterium]|nr:FdtA/QdtA family cupin domain-containing protein [Bacteroidaceae bacterium]